MKLNGVISIVLGLLLLACGSSNNSEEFIKKVSGRYLYNSDEVIEVYFNENKLYMKWRGATQIAPLKVNENTFYVKEMNEKIQFLTNPSDQLDYIVVVPKEEDNAIVYNYRKLNDEERIPSEYLENNEFDKALESFLAIKKKDSLDSAIDEGDLNSLGYRKLREEKYTEAINIFKINVGLYPYSSNVYDSLGEAFMKSGDTVQAIENYKKSLELDSGNSRAKRHLKNLEKKE
jgi:tetratricopeptide (TPR) repeat protein